MPTENPMNAEKTLKIAAKWLLLLVLGTSLIAACAQIRKVTYPRDFVYLEGKKVTGQMALFSLYLREIDDILLDDSIRSSEQQQQIIAILSKLEAGANELGAGPVKTSHLLIDDNIDRFRADVGEAMRGVSADPPNYFALGQLSGSCLACHRYR